jgi:putative ABC transport system permease protein
VGVARRQVLAVFLAESALLALVGGLAGVALGWAGTRLLVALYPALPASAPWWAVVASLALASLIGMLFGWLPARRATRLDPVEALAPRR